MILHALCSILWWPTGRHDKLVSIDEQNLFLWSLDTSKKTAQVSDLQKWLSWFSHMWYVCVNMDMILALHLSILAIYIPYFYLILLIKVVNFTDHAFQNYDWMFDWVMVENKPCYSIRCYWSVPLEFQKLWYFCELSSSNFYFAPVKLYSICHNINHALLTKKQLIFVIYHLCSFLALLLL